MGKHFISVLGTGAYKNAVYSYGDNSFETPYVQEALLGMLFEHWEPEDKISIFLTPDAKKLNWEDRPYKEWEKNNESMEADGIRIGLKSVLQKDYSQFLDDEEKCMIPIGADETELWEIFQVVFSRLNEDEELYIDITHALRNIPIQMLAVVAYARVIKRVKVKGIYYGAFETKEQHGGITPILDLITFLDILDWSQAANNFVKYGNSDQIFELFKSQQKKVGTKQQTLYKIVSEIHNITHGLETSRGYYDFKKNKMKKGTSVLESYRQYKEVYQSTMRKDLSEDQSKQRQRNIIEPLGELLQVMDERVKVFDVESNLETGLAAIQWAIDNKNTQQGFTALEETVKTFLCNHYGLNESDRTDRESICKSICWTLYEACCKRKATDFEISQIRTVTKQKWMEAYGEKKNISEDKVEKIQCMFATIPIELLEILHEISDRRNSMNHFGFSNQNNFPCDSLEQDLRRYFKQFKEIIASMEH